MFDRIALEGRIDRGVDAVSRWTCGAILGLKRLDVVGSPFTAINDLEVEAVVADAAVAFTDDGGHQCRALLDINAGNFRVTLAEDLSIG